MPTAQFAFRAAFLRAISCDRQLIEALTSFFPELQSDGSYVLKLSCSASDFGVLVSKLSDITKSVINLGTFSAIEICQGERTYKYWVEDLQSLNPSIQAE